MIGISLALQVNNWNELRKDKSEEIQALNDLRAEFISAQEIFLIRKNSKRDFEEKWMSLLRKVMDKNMPQSDKSFSRGGTGSGITDISNSILNALLSTGKVDKLSNDTLKYLLLEWKDVFVDYLYNEEEHLEFPVNKLREDERH